MTAENTGKAKTLPLVGDFIARGVLPFLETNPGELGVPVLPPPDLQKITARAAKLLRGLGGWKATAFELALASVSSTDDSGGGGARDVSVWVNSRTACGGFRHRAVRDRMAAVPKKEQEETVAEEGVQGTKGRGSGTQETTATNPRSVRAKVGSNPPTEIATPADGNRLAAVLGVGGDVSRDANSPHHSWLRGVSVWLEDGAVADGAMTYELVSYRAVGRFWGDGRRPGSFFAFFSSSHAVHQTEQGYQKESSRFLRAWIGGSAGAGRSVRVVPQYRGTSHAGHATRAASDFDGRQAAWTRASNDSRNRI
jgi:hypothetical protein